MSKFQQLFVFDALNRFEMVSTRRKDRVATTFWFDKKLKERLQQTASRMGSTTTDLINRAVEIYLDRGYVHDDEMSQKLAISEITSELNSSSQFADKINELDNKIKGLSARIQALEEERQKEERITPETIQNQISIHFESKVQPLLGRLSQLIQRLGEQEQVK